MEFRNPSKEGKEELIEAIGLKVIPRKPTESTNLNSLGLRKPDNGYGSLHIIAL